MNAVVLIQDIHTTWSKKSRGGKAAMERCAIPDAFLIPLQELGKSSTDLIEHSLSFAEWTGFETPIYSAIIQERMGRIRHGSVLIEPTTKGLRVVFEYDPKFVGMPIRYSPPGGKPSTRMELQIGQWGRVVYNGRFADDEWWYAKHILNVGYFKEINPTIFTASKPSQEISQMARLW